MMRSQGVPRFLFLFATFLLISCEGPNGPDGKDGRAFLKITSSDGYLYAYSDNNPSMPSPLIAGQNYQVSTGTYIFAYESRIYTSATTYTYQQWLGTYSISINFGTKGGKGKIFWQEGDPGTDGRDKYFTIYCDFNGPEQNVLGKRSNMPGTGISTAGTLILEQGEFLIEVKYQLKEKGTRTKE
ncbi:MAG: hypothetical protein AB1728_11075 [Bacteroidota bacterium]